MRKGLQIAGLCVVLSLAFAGSAQAVNQTYSFSSNDEGWTSSQSSSDGLHPVTWNPTGFVSALDSGAETGCATDTDPCELFFFISPGVNGTLANNYGGSISMDVGSEQSAEFSGIAYIDVAGGPELRHVLPSKPGSGLQHISVPLTEGGWTWCPSPSSSTCHAAMVDEFKAVLAAARYTDIQNDFVDGTGETYFLDNFTIAEPPPPPAPPALPVTPPKKKKCKKKKGKKKAAFAKKKKCKKKGKKRAALLSLPGPRASL